MRAINHLSVLSLAVALAVTGCQKPANHAAAAAPAADPAPAAAPTAAAATWPTSLVVVGDGFPNLGDPCRQIGESEATVDYLDDSATLAGCLSADAAAKLGGRVVGTVDGVTLVSVPSGTAIPGDGDGQGDAKIPGTDYHAAGPIACSGYKDFPAGRCDAGVIRHTEHGSQLDVTLPDGTKRTIFFNKDGSFLSFSTAQSDGTAGMEISSSRKDYMTIAMLGSERYEIPDVFIMGD
jgi:hypothetical protein